MMAITRLMATPHMVIGEATCQEMSTEPGPEEEEPAFTVIFPVSGMFVRHTHGEEILATAATAVFATPGETHRTAHPAGGHDRSLFFSVGEPLAGQFEESAGRNRARRAEVTAELTLRVTRMAAAARAGRLGELAAEESIVNTISELGQPPARDGFPERHRRLARDAEEYLTTYFAEDCGLKAIAAEVGASPHHLSRVFRRVTGDSLTGYRTRIRLAHAIDRISGGDTDLARVAVETGFYDQAHLTNTMRRHTGMTPARALDGGAAAAHRRRNEHTGP